jgi:TPR repeat protein
MEHAALTNVGRLMRCRRPGVRAAFVGLVFSVCLAASLAAAGPLEDGAEAAERGDYATALRLWRPLADQGNPYAQYKVGLTYDVGVGAPQDFIEAAKWYLMAADQGHAGAQFNLGLLYANGRGVAQDLVQAHMWLNLAAAGLEPAAQRERDLVAKKMTRSQIAEAIRLARAWKPMGNALPPPPSEPPGSTDDHHRP